ncbi:MAG: universal stress protein [Comamonadaceae bacterium]|nr:MAG: universal stress protein [Comamonadaceae bacterium]
MADTLAQLLVHVDSSARSSERLALACQLAARHGAALTGLYAAAPSFTELTLGAAPSPEYVASLVAIDDAKRARARAVFDSACAGHPVRSAWSELTEPPAIGGFVQQSLYADLLVFGQHDAADPAAADVPPDFVESVLGVCGKPALVIPYAGAVRPVGGTVMVAWKETRESARALAAALPLLRLASQVHVVTFGEKEEPFVSGAGLSLETYLKLHGVRASLHHGGPEPQQVGELLLSRAFDFDADLLVMGCYGHSRAREWVLGGASRSVLRSMTLPVLMAH